MLSKKRFSPHTLPSLACVAAPVFMREVELAGVRHIGLPAIAEEARSQAIVDRINNLPFAHAENWHKLDFTFGPIHKWLKNWEATGEFDVVDDMPIIRPNRRENVVFPLVDALRAIGETYELIAQDLCLPDHSAPVMHLAQLISDGVMVDQHDTQAARESLGWMREVTKQITPNQYSEYAVVIQTRAEFAARARLQDVPAAIDNGCI